MGSYLGLCRVRSIEDIGSGLFLCTLWLQFEELSNRFVPEAINFLANSVLHLAPHGYKEAAEVPGSFPSPDFSLSSGLTIDPKSSRKLTISSPDFGLLFSGETGEQVKLNLLALTLTLLERFADLYKGLDGFLELYRPVYDILDKLHVKNLSAELKVFHFWICLSQRIFNTF